MKMNTANLHIKCNKSDFLSNICNAVLAHNNIEYHAYK